MADNRFALIIATTHYEDPGLSRLVAPAADAEALARVLADPQIGDFEAEVLLNEPSHVLTLRIESFFANRKRDDLLLLYFSGHGIKDEDGQLYFAVTNTRRPFLRATAVSANFVNEVMRRSRSRRQVLLLDVCYSGAFARGMRVRADEKVDVLEYFREGQGQAVLTASDAMQYAFEGDEVTGDGARSVFTDTLVQGLESGQADRDFDGYVSFDDMYGYMYEQVTAKMPQQQPRKWVFDLKGKLIIARNPSPVAKPLPQEIRDAIESPLAAVREAVISELARLLRGSDLGLSLAAREVLAALSEDDSRKVSAAAVQVLQAAADSVAKAGETAEPAQFEVPRVEAQPEQPAGPARVVREPQPEPAVAPGPVEAVQPVEGLGDLGPVRGIGPTLGYLRDRVRAAKGTFIRWLLFNWAGGVLGVGVGGLLLVAFEEVGILSVAQGLLGGDERVVLLGMSAGAGLTVGLAQCLALRSRISSAWGWVLATGLGWTVGAGMMGGVIGFAPGPALPVPLSIGVWSGLCAGALTGAVQICFLKTDAPHARLWLLANVLVWPAAYLTGGIVGLAVDGGFDVPIAFGLVAGLLVWPLGLGAVATSLLGSKVDYEAMSTGRVVLRKAAVMAAVAGVLVLSLASAFTG